jgi:hypothetical protein
MSAYPTEPFFVGEFKLKSGGLDFLGMRQATLDLRDECLPGFSNSTEYLRPFSLMCWTYWKIHGLAEAAGLDEITSEQARSFREKVEILFTWGHQLHKIAGLPGITAKAPNPVPGAGGDGLPLTFDKWKRIPSSTGLMAAVNYGPALKPTSGFGFLTPVAVDLFKPMVAGLELAQALDECMPAKGMPAALKTLDPKTGTKKEALNVFNSWSIGTPSSREQVAFRAILYSASAAADSTSTSFLSLRSATFDLILSILKKSAKSLNVEQVRELMFLGQSALPSLKLTPHAKAARQRWILLQVRQAQRLAMESILSWIERRILYDGDKYTSELAIAAEGLCSASKRFRNRDWMRYAKNHVGRQLAGVEDAVQFAASIEEMSILKSMNALGQCIRDESNDILPSALALLGLCREYTVVLQKDPALQGGLRQGGSEGLSLTLWNDICIRSAHLNNREFLLMVIEELVLSRHFAVATRRYDGRVIRLRITIGENGLIALVPWVWRPAPARDKLASGLSLMADCGLIARAGSEFAFARH